MSIVYHSPAGDMWLCFSCGKYYHTMMGDICDKCRLEERRHQELLSAIKKAAQQSVQPTLVLNGENAATWKINPSDMQPPAISG